MRNRILEYTRCVIWNVLSCMFEKDHVDPLNTTHIHIEIVVKNNNTREVKKKKRNICEAEYVCSLNNWQFRYQHKTNRFKLLLYHTKKTM